MKTRFFQNDISEAFKETLQKTREWFTILCFFSFFIEYWFEIGNSSSKN